MPHDQRILDMHNTCSGRIFILGNGPSLLETKGLEMLKDEVTFCCNNFGMWTERPFDPTYYGISDIIDMEVLENRVYPEIETIRFNTMWEGPQWPTHDAFIHVEKHEGNGISGVGFVGLGDTLPPLPTGRTTPFTNTQIAAWLGYREFYFLGIEQSHGYVHDPKGEMTYYRRQVFPVDNHVKYFLAVQRCGARMRQDIEQAGGSIYDCTPHGFLNETGPMRSGDAQRKIIFQYKSLEEVLAC